ncbi:PAS domain-containing protein [Ruegeria sp. HKCCD8929]|uniref:PAS domain-containing protein n=1 Tax=Ruegeria sp. HKCCD8929 TaxID=2683006 RepID=UPI00148830E1|nr:PAS domain-containing protein [Ruegeria sp. HKCCD8929]
MRTFFGNGPGSEVGKVVAMDRFRSGRSLSPIRQAEAYWTALRTDGGVPNRSNIDPRGLENILEYTFILERIAPGIARFRLAGNHLSKLAGMEVRGMPLTAFFTAAARREISATLEHLFDTPAVAELEMGSEKRMGRAQIEARMILLPLKSDLGDISRVLGVMVADGPISKTPYSFGVTKSRLRDLNQPEAKASAPQPVTGFAEDQAPLDSPAPHLRLVVSRDS